MPEAIVVEGAGGGAEASAAEGASAAITNRSTHSVRRGVLIKTPKVT